MFTWGSWSLLPGRSPTHPPAARVLNYRQLLRLIKFIFPVFSPHCFSSRKTAQREWESMLLCMIMCICNLFLSVCVRAADKPHRIGQKKKNQNKATTRKATGAEKTITHLSSHLLVVVIVRVLVTRDAHVSWVKSCHEVSTIPRNVQWIFWHKPVWVPEFSLNIPILTVLNLFKKTDK